MTEPASENQANPPGPAQWPRRILGAVALAVLVFAGAEATVRIEDRIRWGMPFFATDTAVSDLAVSDRTGRHPAPGRVFRKWHFNSVGTRGPEPDPARADHRVVVLGASETFGLYESPDREYSRQLADSLTNGSCAADILNAGFPGMSLPTVEQDFRLRLSALQPRAVIYYPTPPQYLDDKLPIPVKRDSTSSPVAPSPWHSRFKIRVRDALKAMLPRPLLDALRRRDIADSRSVYPADSMFTTVPADRLAAFDRDLRHLVETLHAHGATPILVTHANAFIGTPPAAADRLRAWERFEPRATGATLVAFDSAANESIRRIAADSGTELVDAWREFHGLPSEKMFADFSHFTDAGAARMATVLRPAVARALGCRSGA